MSAKSLARAGAWWLAGGFFGGWGLFRRRPFVRRAAPPLPEVRSLLAIRLDLMGDLVFTLPAIAALREGAPRARITALVLPYTAELLRGHPTVDRVIAVDVNRWRRPGAWIRGTAWRELRAVVAELRAERYDLAVSFYGRVGAAAALMSGARRLAGYGAEGYPFTFDLALPGRRYASRQHEAEYCLDLARALGVPGQSRLPELRVNPACARAVERLLSEEGVVDGERLVALHPGALNMVAKRWLPERWAEVADRVQRELGRRVVLVGSASERSLAETVRRTMGTAPVMLAGRTTMGELVALLARCELFLGGDSGPLHVASALGIPSVSVYGPTDPALTGPLGPQARVLRAGAECSPCYDLGGAPECRRGDLQCLARVSAEEVFETVREVGTGGQGEDGGGGEGEVPEPGTQNPEPHSALTTQRSALIERILVVKLAGIGDMLTAFPALGALRRTYPRARIEALATPQTASLLERGGIVDRVIVLDKYLYDEAGGFLRPRTLAGLARLAAELRRQRFDAAILLHHLVTWPGVVKYSLLMLGSGAPLRAGLDDGRGRFLNRPTRDLGFGALHEVEYWLEVVEKLGATASDSRIRISWGPAEEAFAEETWGRLGFGSGDRVVAFHPGVGSYSPVRRWGVDRFAAVANALAAKGLMPMVVAGPGEEALARQLVGGVHGPCALLEGVPSLHGLAAVLARCRLFVGNDSGVTHLAFAAGVPVVAVFGPSNAKAWGPYDPTGERSRVVRLGLPCSPCLYRGHSLGLRNGCGNPRCLLDLSPSAVLTAANELLSFF